MGQPLRAFSFLATFSSEFSSSLGTSFSSWATFVYLAFLSRCGNICSEDLDIVAPEKQKNLQHTLI